jgi:heme a synthase
MAPRTRVVGVWLLLVATFIVAMVVVGGLTRLTRSGLSIVEWKPLTGVLPPITDAEWTAEYAKYQATPEGRLVNAGMSMEAFQGIFYVEWGHRLLGRLTGLVVLVPFVFFLVTRRLTGRRALAVLGLFLLGALQGLAGWLMVKSGLVDRPHVSHFRLTIHLSLALLLFGLTMWAALSELVGRRARVGTFSPPLTPWAIGAITTTAFTIVWGGLVAGLHAGLAAPTFPTMNGSWIPAGLLLPDLGVLGSATENPIAVHFVHRLLAYGTALGVLVVAALAHVRRASTFSRVAALAMVAHVALQIVLGALTVLQHVPIHLASLHQLNATLLLGWAVVFLYGVRRT